MLKLLQKHKIRKTIQVGTIQIKIIPSSQPINPIIEANNPVNSVDVISSSDELPTYIEHLLIKYPKFPHEKLIIITKKIKNGIFTQARNQKTMEKRSPQTVEPIKTKFQLSIQKLATPIIKHSNEPAHLPRVPT